MANSSSLCLTSACLHAASSILWNLAPNFQEVDPCTNFEQLVCYGFRQQYDQDLETLLNIGNRNKRILEGIVTSTYQNAENNMIGTVDDLVGNSPSIDENNFNILQRSYLACMDEAAIQAAGAAPLGELIIDIDNILNFDQSNSTLQPQDYEKLAKAILYLEQRGVSTFEDITARTNPVNPNTTAIFVGPILPTPGSTDPTTIATVLQSILPQNVSDSTALSVAQGVADLEATFLNAYPPAEDLEMDRIYNYRTLANFTDLAPSLGLGSVIQQLVPKNYSVDKVILVSPTYLSNVSDIVTETPKVVLKNWLTWRAIVSFANDVDSAALEPLKGTATTGSRSETCFTHIDQTLTWILSRFYVSAAFAESDRQYGDKMMTEIRTQFIQRIENRTWIPDDTKKLIVEKVNNVQQNIGYPTSSPNVKDPASLATYYAGLNITDNHFGNVISSRLVKKANAFAALARPVDRGAFTDGVYGANAVYQAQGNNIFIQAGAMQLPIFSADVPSYVSYGALGAILGHELTHGFDTYGRLYDPSGAYKQWWDNATIAEFDSRAQCFVDQYGNYTVPGFEPPINVDGHLTVAENVADAGGINTAYDTWKSKHGQGQDLNLPGLDFFTQEQLFYISFGNMWCNSYTDAHLRDQVQSDGHSPSSVRISGATANSRGFREAFNCPIKEPTCELW